ncbi:uncharacterized protein LOC114339303 [Diabrotica virgifera virgifera]|nr:uncharacterized protein LOC114339303 [Diabrotica virgifera virgifera]
MCSQSIVRGKDVDCNSNFYLSKVVLNIEEAEELYFATLSQSGSKWLDERRCRITGSICYQIYTYAFNSNPNWEQKVKSIFYSTFRGNANTRYGTEQEVNALKLYNEVHDCAAKKGGFIVNPQVPWVGFSPDALLDEDNKVTRLIEIKCPILGKSKSVLSIVRQLSYIKIINGQLQLNKKHQYYAQVQLGMGILGIKDCDLFIYCSYDKSFFTLPIKFDEEFVTKMLTILKEVYFEKIVKYLEIHNH